MFDQVIWLISNIAATSSTLKKMMLSNTYVIQELTKYFSKNNLIKKGHLKTIIWCCCNLSQPSVDEVDESLTEEELNQIIYILVVAIEFQTGDDKDLNYDSILEEALFGLIRILRKPNEKVI